jgi:hypothetical protein
MKRLAVVLMALGLLALGACASSKPCPAYAKVIDNQEVKG